MSNICWKKYFHLSNLKKYLFFWYSIFVELSSIYLNLNVKFPRFTRNKVLIQNYIFLCVTYLVPLFLLWSIHSVSGRSRSQPSQTKISNLKLLVKYMTYKGSSTKNWFTRCRIMWQSGISYNCLQCDISVR